MAEPDVDVLLGMYEVQARIVAVDEQFRQRIARGQVSLVYYSPRGQECISAALGAHLRAEDYLVTTYRGVARSDREGDPVAGVGGRVLGSHRRYVWG
jgi:pyruvate dehydrogenase E1 component alpha subunit